MANPQIVLNNYLVFQVSLLTFVEMTALCVCVCVRRVWTAMLAQFKRQTYTLMSLVPSSFTLILLPTISAGYTKSSKMASCTAVNVRLQESNRGFRHSCMHTAKWYQEKPMLIKNNSLDNMPEHG